MTAPKTILPDEIKKWIEILAEKYAKESFEKPIDAYRSPGLYNQIYVANLAGATSLYQHLSEQKDKEIERLKGLIEKAFKECYVLGKVHPGNNKNRDWETFKTENNL